MVRYKAEKLKESSLDPAVLGEDLHECMPAKLAAYAARVRFVRR